jgi:hypothetical protein
LKRVGLYAAQKEIIRQLQEEAAMGEEEAGQESMGVPMAERRSAHAAIQSAAEPGDAPWSAPPLPKPKLPPKIPSLPKPSMPTAAISSKDETGITTWNTHNLGLRAGADALAAASAGVLVAPIITMIDKAIIENASGRNTLAESLRHSTRELLLRPHRFLASKPFVLIFVRIPILPCITCMILMNVESLFRHIFHCKHHRHHVFDTAQQKSHRDNRRHK